MINDPTILAISGSERSGGNTDYALDYVSGLAGARGFRLDVVRLREHDVVPCGRCGDCNVLPAPCHVDDDMPRIIERMTGADAIIYAAPVHGFGMAHPMQVFIERAGVGYLRFARPLANKVGGAIVVSRRYSDSHVHQQLVLNMLLNRMIVVGSGFPALLRGGAPGNIARDTEGFDALDRMVHRMCDMVTLLRAYRDAVGEPPLACDDANERQTRARVAAFTGAGAR